MTKQSRLSDRLPLAVILQNTRFIKQDIMMKKKPDNTALRTALWRALHVLTDDKPYIIEDSIGYNLIKPEKDWQERPDMKYTKRLRASIVARARFVEDEAKEQIAKGETCRRNRFERNPNRFNKGYGGKIL